MAKKILVKRFIWIRWQKCVGVASSDDKGFGMAAGHSYVNAKFDDESRAVVIWILSYIINLIVFSYRFSEFGMNSTIWVDLQASALIEDIRVSFKDLVSESLWMDVETQVGYFDVSVFLIWRILSIPKITIYQRI